MPEAALAQGDLHLTSQLDFLEVRCSPMDAYTVGYLTGAVTCPAAIAYFVGRKLVGPSGVSWVSEVQRLALAAGVAEPGAKPPSRLRGLVPYALALAGALFGFVFGAVSLIAERRSAEPDRARLEQEFLKGCARACVAPAASGEACASYCGCVLGELKQAHGSAG